MVSLFTQTLEDVHGKERSSSSMALFSFKEKIYTQKLGSSLCGSLLERHHPKKGTRLSQYYCTSPMEGEIQRER